ncbi:glycosyltransferase family 2 protein [Microbacterium sp. 2C]|uniref:glycosyltransferase family 2 protein n=1 Tax=Microbacterium paulum TaxID=2707006 RepID=UPI0018C28167|nr:glycosyltransferase family 2 protein [Microbacterium paulum]MBG0717949.1 glycosyltransferase family 2 protein [Microbacterium paulum]
MPDATIPSLSIVIPAFDSAPWLPSTFAALAEAITVARAEIEVIVVDDGSTDDTAGTACSLAESFPAPVSVITQPNGGRFLARFAGLEAAHARHVLFLDSRVLVDATTIRHVLAALEADGAPRAWNAYVRTDSAAPLVGLFWEVPTHVFWGRFLRSPRPFDLTPETFDQAPKGTTMFLGERDLLLDAFNATWPEGDARLVSDDTKLLRWIAAHAPIRLDPEFSATYRPRTTLASFVRHTFDRGTLFVDSYAGTTRLRSVVLVLLALAPVALLAGGALLLARGARGAVAVGLGLSAAAILAPVVLAARNRAPARGILAYVACLPVFVVPFWLGLVRGTILHRASFTPKRDEESA